MNVEEIIYSHNDPCLDLYYSIRYMELVFGARRPLPNKKVSLDCLTHQIKLWPSDDDLGDLLTTVLYKPSLSDKYDAVCPWSISSAQSLEDFRLSFQFFCIWTKPNPAVPIMIGAPIDDRYPETFNRRVIEKSKSVSVIGSEVAGFMKALASELGRRGFEQWKL